FFVVCLPTAQSGHRVGVVVALIIVNAPRRNGGSSMLFSVRLVLGKSRSNKNVTECGEDKKRFHGHSERSPYRSNRGTSLGLAAGRANRAEVGLLDAVVEKTTGPFANANGTARGQLRRRVPRRVFRRTSRCYGRWSTGNGRVKVWRPRLRPSSGCASSATAAAGSAQSSTTTSAGLPTAIP